MGLDTSTDKSSALRARLVPPPDVVFVPISKQGGVFGTRFNPGLVEGGVGGAHAVVDEGEDAFLFLVRGQWRVYAREGFSPRGEIEFWRGVGECGGSFFEIFVQRIFPMRTFDGKNAGAGDGVIEEGGD